MESLQKLIMEAGSLCQKDRVVFIGEVEERIEEVRSRLCTCEYPQEFQKCHCCRIINELFTNN